MSNDDFDADALISAVKKHVCIWNYKDKGYSNKTTKNRAWMEVVAEITPDFENKSTEEKNLIGLKMQSKWKNLKDAFTRNHRNMKKKSGSAASTPRLYPYYEQMFFLKNLLEERGSTTSSISVPLPSDSEASEITETEGTSPSLKPGKSTTTQRKRNFNKEEEDRLILKISKRLGDKINQEKQPEKPEDEDKMFLLSLLSDFKKISKDNKLDAKSEIIQVIRNYRYTSVNNNYSTGNYYNNPPSHLDNNYYGFSTVPPPPPPTPPPPPQITVRPESQSSSYSFSSSVTSLAESENALSPESFISELFD